MADTNKLLDWLYFYKVFAKAYIILAFQIGDACIPLAKYAFTAITKSHTAAPRPLQLGPLRTAFYWRNSRFSQRS